jgi:Phosphate-selective porin O and P
MIPTIDTRTRDDAGLPRARRHAVRRLCVAVTLALLAVLRVTERPASADLGTAQPPALGDAAPDGQRWLDDRLWLGGDLTVAGELLEDGPSSIEIDDINLLLRYEPLPQLAFFSETRIENTLNIENENVQTRSDVAIERLYADWFVGSGLTVRVGKFLTPFGLWNVIRRAPLTWTVERPLVTDQTFPEHATGVSAMYETTVRGWTLDAVAYGPAQNELSLQSSDEDSRLLTGGRLAAAHALGPAFLSLGLNGAGAERGGSRRMRALYGTDVEVDLWGQQIMAEAAAGRSPGRDGTDVWGLYLQDAIPLRGSTLYGVVRFEHFDPSGEAASDGGLVGLVWRPWEHLIVKADYQFTTTEREDLRRGLLGSIALFF